MGVGSFVVFFDKTLESSSPSRLVLLHASVVVVVAGAVVAR